MTARDVTLCDDAIVDGLRPAFGGLVEAVFVFLTGVANEHAAAVNASKISVKTHFMTFSLNFIT